MANKTINKTTNKTTNKTINKVTDTTTNKTINKTINKAINKATNKTTDTTTNKTTNKTINKAINKTINKTINKATDTTTVEPARHPFRADPVCSCAGTERTHLQPPDPGQPRMPCRRGGHHQRHRPVRSLQPSVLPSDRLRPARPAAAAEPAGQRQLHGQQRAGSFFSSVLSSSCFARSSSSRSSSRFGGQNRPEILPELQDRRRRGG